MKFCSPFSSACTWVSSAPSLVGFIFTSYHTWKMPRAAWLIDAAVRGNAKIKCQLKTPQQKFKMPEIFTRIGTKKPNPKNPPKIFLKSPPKSCDSILIAWYIFMIIMIINNPDEDSKIIRTSFLDLGNLTKKVKIHKRWSVS